MKMRFFFRMIWASVFAVALFSSAAAQEKDVSEYFEDKGISNAKNIVSIGLSILAGDVPVFYERALGKRFSVEAGLGLVLPFYFVERSTYDEGPSKEGRKPGSSIHLSARYFLAPHSPEGFFIGPKYRRRAYNFEDGFPIIINDLYGVFGYNLFLKKRFLVGMNVGGGLRFVTDVANPIDQTDSFQKNPFLILPVSFRFGFIF